MKRPWGEWEVLLTGEGFKVKGITVEPGRTLSYQRHQKRNEHWVVVNGRAEVTLGEMRFALMENESCYIPAKEWHQLSNLTDNTLKVIEVSTGNYIEEDDIERKSL